MAILYSNIGNKQCVAFKKCFDILIKFFCVFALIFSHNFIQKNPVHISWFDSVLYIWKKASALVTLFTPQINQGKVVVILCGSKKEKIKSIRKVE